MKRIYTALFSVLVVYSVNAQQDTVWRTGALFSLNFSQVSLTNWAAGGQNSISGNVFLNYFANYKRGKNAWDNNINLAYGLVLQGKNSSVEKSDDRIEFTSIYGRQASPKWYYSALLNFRSQFANGYNYPNDSTIISRFLAPGYLTFALGMNYKPNDYFSLFLSPSTVRFVIVTDDALSNAGAFGVDPGEHIRTEVGAYVKAMFKKDLGGNINLMSSLDLFSNYLDKPQNIDINWQMLLSFKVNPWLAASLGAQLIYDDNTDLTFFKDDGTVDHVGPGTQFKEVFGIGLSFKYAKFGVK